MANEVINETEASAQNDAPVSEQTNTNSSGESAAEAIPVSAEANQDASNNSTTAETPSVENSAATETSAPAAAAEQPRGVESSSSTEEDFGSILEKFEQEQTTYHSGELVEGKVVGISERGVLIDFGYKSEGIAPIEDFTSPTGEVNVVKDDTVEVIIRSISSGDAPPILSRIDAVSRKSWDVIEKAFNDETPITGRVVGVTKGGLQVDLEGVEAFLPGSQVDSRPIRNLNSFVGQDIETKVIKFSRKRNNIVLSRKVLTDEVVNKQKAETLGQIEEGYIIDGTIKNLTEYGAFVDIGGLDGLLHVTDMSWGRLQNPGDQFKVGDTVQVKVLKLDREKEKVALGYKQLIPDPWSTVMEIYPINGKIKGRISSVTDYGAFVELEPGVEGLVHVSEMSWSKRSQSPKKLVHSGDEVEVQVLGVDTEERRISLGMKQLQPNPWQTVHDRYHIGQTVRGRVRNLTDFGAFIEIEDGIDGLVHISDISHSKKIKHPKDALKRDQEVEAVIRSIDTNNRRMSLSIKELTPSVWEQFVATHKPGDVVRGRISRFTGFGVFVELGSELEGLCHISELSDERIERPEDIGSIGQEMDFKILRIESDTQKIGLSHRAVGKEDEPVIDTKNYSTEAKGGMTSLGELMNLKRGGEDDVRAEQPEQPRLSKKERKAIQAQERVEQERLAAERAATEAEQQQQQQQNTETETAAAEETSENTTIGERGANDTQSFDSNESATGVDDQQIAAETPPMSETAPEQSAETPTGEAEAETAAHSIENNSAETPSENAGEAAVNTSATDTAEESTASAAPASEGEMAAEMYEAAQNKNASQENEGAAADAIENSDSERAQTSTDSEEKTANG